MSVLTLLLTLLAASDRVNPEEVNQSLMGKSIILEGMVQGSIGTEEGPMIRLRDSPARFLLDKEKKVERFRPGTIVEIEGKVARRGNASGEVIVDIWTIKALPDDLTRINAEAERLRGDDDEGHFKLVEFAESRFARYKVAEVGRRVEELRTRAIEIRRLKSTENASELRKLAELIRSTGKPPGYDLPGLEHQILHAELRSLAKPSPAELRDLAGRLRAKLLSENGLPTRLSREEEDRYERDPVVSFAAALDDPNLRRKFVRYQEVRLLERALQTEFEQGDQELTRLFSFAERCRTEFPEYPELVRQWVKRGLTKVSGRLVSLNRAEVTQLAEKVAADLDDQAAADTLRREWVRVQAERIRENEKKAVQRSRVEGLAPPVKDAQGRYDIGSVALDWLPEDKEIRELAGKLLHETLVIDNTFRDAEVRLRGLGWRQSRSGEWVAPDRLGTAAEGVAGTSREIRPGDTSERVIQALGRPNSISRVVGRNWSRQYWEYENRIIVMRDATGGVGAIVESLQLIK